MHSLSTIEIALLVVLAGFFIALGIVCAWQARKSAVFARSCAEWMSENNTKSASMARIAEISSEMTEVTDALHSLIKQHKRLRSRIGMRELRKKRKQAGNSEAPVVELDLVDAPGSKKADLRVEAKRQGLLR